MILGNVGYERFDEKIICCAEVKKRRNDKNREKVKKETFC